MKGIVFNLLEEIVQQTYGEDTWDDLLEKATLDGAYTSLGNYPDEHLGRLVSVTAQALDMSPEAVVCWVGREALPLMAVRFPSFFTPHDDTRSFVLTLNSIIHPEVRKLYPGADVPEFGFDTSSPDTLIMRYNSARKMCAFARGLIEGAAAYYGEQAEFHQSQCMHRGDRECIFEIAFRAIHPKSRPGDALELASINSLNAAGGPQNNFQKAA